MSRPPHRSPRRRRWPLFGAAVIAVLAVGAIGVHRAMPAWYARLWHPLEYENAIRSEADRYGLDSALVAAVAEAESGFTPDSRSSEGAVGVMQILPGTARFIARQPTRPSPSPERLTEPDVGFAYGAWYLRYLIDRHGSVPSALAAYNAGESNLSRWEEAAESQGRSLRVPEDIPFTETREFVSRVEDLAKVYRRSYDDRLGAPIPGLARVTARRRIVATER
jgi:soluble lytic murein transglycosylase